MEKIKAWFKNTWAKRPWLLGIIAGGLVAAGYWVYTKAAASGGSSTADSSLGTHVSLGSSGAGSGTDTSAGSDIGSIEQSFADAIQQSQQANTDLLNQSLSANESSNSSLFSGIQQQLDNLTSLASSTLSIAQRAGNVPAVVVQPVVPLAASQPIVTPSFAQPPLPNVFDQQPQLTIPVAAAPAIENITKALNGGLLSSAAAKNMIDAVNATPVPAGTPTGSAIKVPAGSIPYPTGVSVAQGLAMATAFASTPFTAVVKAVSTPSVVKAPVVVKTPVVVKAPVKKK